MEFAPATSVLAVMVAVPLERVPVPSTVVPFLNVTVSPSGMLPEVEVTVAVKVTACPTVEGFELEDKVVVVLFLRTFCETVLRLVAEVVSPA
jgi:hypothetical protein